MPDISVPWGDGELGISLPEKWKVQQVASPALRAAPVDWSDRLARALNQPGAGPPLGKLLDARRNGRIALVVEDLTRHSPLPEILGVVLREVRHAGVADEQMDLVFATGMHVPMTPQQADGKLGDAGNGLRWRCNPWHDPAEYVSVGRAGKVDVSIDRRIAEADLRIIVSSVSPHLQAGFGGGYKMLLPGCASLETIRALHRLGLGRTARQFVGMGAERNAMRAAIDAGGSLVDRAGGRSFAVQYLLDADDRPAFNATGEVLSAQRMLAKQCAVACGIVTSAAADVLITNAHPRDFDLWQSFKCIPNTCWAARRDGVIICLARCEGGMEGMNPPPWPLSPRGTRCLVRMLGPSAIASLVKRLVPRLAGDAAFFLHLALQTVHRNRILLVSPALHATGERFPGLELFADVQGAITAAARELGAGPQRVIVFPSGGVTFPIPSTRPVSRGSAT